MQILAISGSLRAASTNTTLLRAAAALAPADDILHGCSLHAQTLRGRNGPYLDRLKQAGKDLLSSISGLA